ncbi:hypothetical protein CTM63_10785 [Prevotella intermedia]|nr:hypothetical protein CTM63_10785 [Prevotella intermedia]
MERIYTLYNIGASNVAFRNSKVCWQNYVYKRFGIDKKAVRLRKEYRFSSKQAVLLTPKAKITERKNPISSMKENTGHCLQYKCI